MKRSPTTRLLRRLVPAFPARGPAPARGIIGLASALLVVGAFSFADSALAADREKTVQALRGIESNPAIGLRTWIEGTVAGEVRVGEPISFHFEAKQPVYLTTVYLDATGVISVIQAGTDEQSRLFPDQARAFPDAGSGRVLRVQPPLGHEDVFAIATTEPLPDHLFADPQDPHRDAVMESSADARHFSQRLADYLSILDAGSVAVASVSQQIVSEDTPQRYSSSRIVDIFTTKTRSLSRQKIDLDIQFESNSDQLTPRAREDLDELGRALEHPAMKSRRFELAGHTDDVGAAEYNMELSKRRARSAYDYLMKRYEIDPQAIQATGYGEQRPLMPGTSNDARRRNRRVVIEQLP